MRLTCLKLLFLLEVSKCYVLIPQIESQPAINATQTCCHSIWHLDKYSSQPDCSTCKSIAYSQSVQRHMRAQHVANAVVPYQNKVMTQGHKMSCSSLSVLVHHTNDRNYKPKATDDIVYTSSQVPSLCWKVLYVAAHSAHNCITLVKIVTHKAQPPTYRLSFPGSIRRKRSHSSLKLQISSLKVPQVQHNTSLQVVRLSVRAYLFCRCSTAYNALRQPYVLQAQHCLPTTEPHLHNPQRDTMRYYQLSIAIWWCAI